MASRFFCILGFLSLFAGKESFCPPGLLDLPNELLEKIACYCVTGTQSVLNIADTCTRLDDVMRGAPLTLAIYGQNHKGPIDPSYVQGTVCTIIVPHKQSNKSTEQKFFDILSPLLKNVSSYNIRSIYLPGEFVSTRNINLFFEIITRCDRLACLVLNHNDILLRSLPEPVDDFHRNLKNALKNLAHAIRARSLETLALIESDPVSTPEGERHYLHYLGHIFSSSLRHLELSGIDEGLPDIIYTLNQLETLRLPYCSVDPQSLLKALPNMRKLQQCDLSNCELECDLLALLKALPPSIQKLSLGSSLQEQAKNETHNLPNLSCLSLLSTIAKNGAQKGSKIF